MRPALTIDSLAGFQLSDDGGYLVVDARSGSSIALHCSVMHEMLAALAHAIAHSERIRQKSCATKFTMHCAGWEVALDADGTGALILSFALQGGAQLSFRIRRDSAMQFHEVIGAATGQCLPAIGNASVQ
ncbi:hypothetical protein [Caballeronia sp. J97]|uniref:hypothetical protein n=1 Tax=Caballeronia sp. J97 TaxID=2805429 RepID=UPI002AB260AF|nr:hypothetical protein [Caballeronia sp. J97]